MHQKLWGSAWLRNAALFVLIGLYWAGILYSDLTIWPGSAPTILFALPLVAVSVTKPPRFVIATALLAVLIDAFDMFIEHPLLAARAFSFLALVGLGFLATLIALERQQAVEKSQRQEARIRAVEQFRQPLTVVKGYTQFLCTRPNLPPGFEVPLERISVAASRLQQQIDHLLDDGRDSIA